MASPLLVSSPSFPVKCCKLSFDAYFTKGTIEPLLPLLVTQADDPWSCLGSPVKGCPSKSGRLLTKLLRCSDEICVRQTLLKLRKYFSGRNAFQPFFLEPINTRAAHYTSPSQLAKKSSQTHKGHSNSKTETHHFICYFLIKFCTMQE
jgi:hypothetical protein